MSYVIRNGLIVPKREVVRRKTHLRVPHAPLILRRIHYPIAKPIVSAVALDTNAAGDVAGQSVASISLTGFTVGTGTNRALLALLCYSAGPTSTSVVWDPAGANQSLTLIISAQDAGPSVKTELWGLVNPTSGTSKTITASGLVLAGFSVLSAISFTGVNQTGGTTSFAHATSNTGSTAGAATASVSVTTATTDAVVSAVAGSAFALTDPGGNSGTKIFFDSSTGIFGGNFEIGGASPQSMTWTGSSGACAGDWVMVGCDVVAATAAAAAAGGTLPLMGVG